MDLQSTNKRSHHLDTKKGKIAAGCSVYTILRPMLARVKFENDSILM